MQHDEHGGSAARAILVTGATGFVGGELVAALLRQTSRPLICAIRAESEAGAAHRGNERLRELLGPADAAFFGERVRWVRADIVEPSLGWDAATWDAVAAEVVEVFHCAASVSFDLPLDEADRINVAGTRHVHELALAAAAHHGRFRRFHHVSTAYVAGRTKGRVDSDHLPADTARNFRNSYERTKARAERYLRAAATAAVPVSIHRPSIIAGDSRTGCTTNWNVLYVPMKMVARGALPAFTRGGRELIDTIAVDVLVDAMLVFSQLDAEPLESHHITAGPTAVTATQVIAATIERARAHHGFEPSSTRLFGPAAWWCLTSGLRLAARLPRRFGRMTIGARLARRCIDRCAVYLPYARIDTVFDAARDHDLLRVFGVEVPRGPDYLQTILDFALETDFGRRPAETPIEAAA